ncbi:putative oxidoreductase, 2OG-Fe(II) oxygenase family [Aspergillus saccharolyticus JOP 1030-1]|uniref:Putative oxidoreductase n=1 Tax=Aspergillus saccharolyticus JOP 1030-1 TaxID=1450539 RepID=A0A318ZDD9_9EURO|nr:putative oxidoreductase [Aspergillus saccharolyticus JOP 1030-1]PYH44587.1 putative oxidoreductase [Aspergillus saccharolyticus JOP 1030-1]
MTDATTVGAAIDLPILDISNPLDPNAGKAMLDAATKYGFLYVDSKGTDFTPDDVKRAFELSQTFFQSPTEEKATCRIEPNNRGWSGMHVETLDPEHQRTGDFKEAFNFGEFIDSKAQQPLPPALAPHESEIAHFADLCQKTCARVLTLLALGLGIPKDFFTTRHDPHQGPTGSILRYLYYPSLTSPATTSYDHTEDVRAGAHSDYGSITLLFQRPGQPGLEIRTPDGSWAPVPVVPHAPRNQDDDDNDGRQAEAEDGFIFPPILINIGDLLSYWTDGLLKSTVHRVVFPLAEQQQESPRDRYSIVFFCHPIDNTELVPVASEPVREYREFREREAAQNETVGYGGGAGALEPGKRALTAHEHLMARLEATYKFEGKK